MNSYFEYTDQLGNIIKLPLKPQRIISLVPSQTELLFDLGLDEEVIGITKFCIHPNKWFISKPRVGGTKNINIEKIKSLQPDLIIANKEENVKEQIEALQEFAPVWTSDVNNLDEALKMIQSVGEMVDKAEKSRSIINNIKRGFELARPFNTELTAAYLIWKEPYMTVGRDTFINDMLQRVGLKNAFSGYTRYPEISLEEIASSQCEVVMLSSEPYPFKEKHISELQSFLPNKKIILVDGEMFSWYGSRLQYAPRYFLQLRDKINEL